MIKNADRSSVAGFTLLEVLITLAMIGVLIGLMLPGVQSMREVSRRSVCQQNLASLSLGLMAYQGRHRLFPIGTVNSNGPIRNEAIGFHHNWISGLLPHLDELALADTIDPTVGVYAPSNQIPRRARVAALLCPSASEVASYSSCYAGIHHDQEAPIDQNHSGVFVLNRPTAIDDVSDGLSYTLFIAEKVSHPQDDLSWFSGTRSTLRNTGTTISPSLPSFAAAFDETKLPGVGDPKLRVGTVGSFHPGGSHWLMGGGQVDFRSASIDSELARQMAHKSDGGLLPDRLSGFDPVQHLEQP